MCVYKLSRRVFSVGEQRNGTAVGKDFPESQHELDLERQEEFSRWIMGSVGKVQERGRKEYSRWREDVCSLQDSGGEMAVRQGLSGRRRLLLPSGKSSAESGAGQLRKRHTGLETLEKHTLEISLTNRNFHPF